MAVASDKSRIVAQDVDAQRVKRRNERKRFKLFPFKRLCNAFAHLRRCFVGERDCKYLMRKYSLVDEMDNARCEGLSLACACPCNDQHRAGCRLSSFELGFI